MRSGSVSSSYRPWIDRLIILNLSLLPSSSHIESNGNAEDGNVMSGRESPGDASARGHLDENASLEELSEHILYYFDFSLHSENVGIHRSIRNRNDWRGEIVDVFSGEEGSGTVCEAAVRFSGLCRALYSLPKPLRDTMSGIDRTDKSKTTKEKTKFAHRPKQVVTLSTCTLVFIRIEEGRDDIFAVVQIPRTKHSSVVNDSNIFRRRSSFKQASFLKKNPVSLLGAHPDAVERIIYTCHSLFQLTRGGGIHSRLLQVEKDDISSFTVNGRKNEAAKSRNITDINNGKDKYNVPLSASVQNATGARRRRGSLLITNTVAVSPQIKHTLDRFEIPTHKEHKSHQNSLVKGISYPGMDIVYYYRKKIRKLSEERKREQQSFNDDPHVKGIDNKIINHRKGVGVRMSMSKHDKSPIEKELAEYQFLLGNLLDVLPIASLRTDLKEHYNVVITRLLQQRKLYDGIGVGRCIVEMLPKPFPTSSQDQDSSSTSQYLPSAPSPYEMLVVNKMIRSILHLNSTPDNDYLRKTKKNDLSKSIFAISTFFHGRHISTRKSSKPPRVSTQIENSETSSVVISTELACLLFEYFRGYKEDPNSISQVMSRFGSTFSNDNGNENETEEKKPTNSDPSSASTYINSLVTKGTFVSDPPVSLVTSDELNSIVHIPNLGTVWIPKIYLNDSKNSGAIYQARAFKYDFSEFSFIFYMDDLPDEISSEIVEEKKDTNQENPRVQLVELGKYSSFKTIRKEGGTKLCEMLGDIGVYVSSLLSDLQNYQRSKFCDSASLHVYGESCLDFLKKGRKEKAGVDVIFIDRKEHNIILLTERKSTFTYESKNPEKKNLLTLNFLEKPISEADKDEDNSKDRLNHLNLDCRHLLASYLPFEVMITFDDIFSEIHRLRFGRSLNSETESNEAVVELCTFLPLGWMYGRAHGSRELYILFDTNIHVTLADVQKAAISIRSEIFNDALL